MAKKNPIASASEVLLSTFATLLAARDIPTVSRTVSHAAREIAGADGATVVLLEGEECFYLDEEALQPLWKGRRFQAVQCVSGLAMLERRPIAIPNIYDDPRVPHDLYSLTFVRSMVLVPAGGEHPIGALGAYWSSEHHASANEITSLTRLADAMAVVLRNLRGQSRLAESEARFRTMADCTPVMIWVNDGQRNEFVNDAFLEFFGLTPEQARGTDWQSTVHPEDREGYVAKYTACVAARTEFRAECRVKRADGQWRWIATHGAPRLASDGTFLGMVGSSLDITDLKVSSARIQEESRRKEQWLSVVGHELRQPVHAIEGAVHLLDERMPAETRRRAFTIIDRQIGQMTRLLDDLLDTAHVVRGDVELQHERLDLCTVLADALETVQRTFAERQQTTALDLRGAPIPVSGDPSRLQQVFTNLFVNAAKYSDPGSPVTIRARVHADIAEVSVSDLGRGISPEFLPRIFDLFTTVGGDRRSYGIGLAVARKLVELHGGTLDGYSEGLGFGSRFVVKLPLLREASAH